MREEISIAHRILPSHLASRDAIFSDFHRALHRAMRCARKKHCVMRGARKKHRASHRAMRGAMFFPRCDFQRFASHIASRDAIFSDFHRALHRAMRRTREKHRSSHRSMRCAREKHRFSHRAMRGARKKHRASHRAMRARCFSLAQRIARCEARCFSLAPRAMVGCDARWKFPRASHPTIAHRILPSHEFSRLHAWSFSAIIVECYFCEQLSQQCALIPELAR